MREFFNNEEMYLGDLGSNGSIIYKEVPKNKVPKTI